MQTLWIPRVVLLLAALLLLPGGAGGQEPVPKDVQSAATAKTGESQPGPMATLHVYANLEQFPTLVLTWDHQKMKKFDPEQLRVSLDKGTPFKPTHVRLEADDPISLAVLVDTTRPDDELLTRISEALASLGPGAAKPSLEQHDRITVYTMDCALIRSADDVPASEAILRAAMNRGLEPLQQRKYSRSVVPCKPALPLLDSLSVVAKHMAQQPGRRVLLVISEGFDAGSKTSAEAVVRLLQQAGVAMFVVEPPIAQDYFRSPEAIRDHLTALIPSTTGRPYGELLPAIAEASGGLTTVAARADLARKLQQVLDLVRGRYIVEFPRRNDAAAGVHSISVLLPKSDAYVRSTGNSVPIADPGTIANALTLPSTPDADQPEKPTVATPASGPPTDAQPLPAPPPPVPAPH